MSFISHKMGQCLVWLPGKVQFLMKLKWGTLSCRVTRIELIGWAIFVSPPLLCFISSFAFMNLLVSLVCIFILFCSGTHSDIALCCHLLLIGKGFTTAVTLNGTYTCLDEICVCHPRARAMLIPSCYSCFMWLWQFNIMPSIWPPWFLEPYLGRTSEATLGDYVAVI